MCEGGAGWRACQLRQHPHLRDLQPPSNGGKGGAGGGRKGEVVGVWARLVVCVGVETLL